MDTLYEVWYSTYFYKRALITKINDTMTQTNNLDSNAVWFDEYIPSMLRGMDAFPTLCHFDT